MSEMETSQILEYYYDPELLHDIDLEIYVTVFR